MLKQRVALCAIAKNENHYIREWVAHYEKIGVQTIFLYDNNDVDGERFDNVLHDYIDTGFVRVIDARGKRKYQLPAYNECYSENGKDYDWMMFFDIDEFLFLNGKDDISDFLSQEAFSNFQLIRINWKMFDDNDILDVEDENYSIIRFTRPSRLNSPYNHHVKTIVRCGLMDTAFRCNPHYMNSPYKACDSIGRAVENTSMRNVNIEFRGAWINHYNTKTIGEYVRFKMRRLYPDQSDEKAKSKLTVDYFFWFNKRTREKVEYAKHLLKYNQPQ